LDILSFSVSSVAQPAVLRVKAAMCAHLRRRPSLAGKSLLGHLTGEIQQAFKNL
jgi:hypothetical protein